MKIIENIPIEIEKEEVLKSLGYYRLKAIVRVGLKPLVWVADKITFREG